MQVMGQADVNGLHLRPLHHLRKVSGGSRCAVPLRLGLGAFAQVVAGHFQARLSGSFQPLPSVEMGMGNTAAPNDGYPNRITIRRHHNSLPLLKSVAAYCRTCILYATDGTARHAIRRSIGKSALVSLRPIA